MEAVIVKLAVGLGIHTAVGWFAPIIFGATNVIPILASLWFYADKSSEFNAVSLAKKSASASLPEITYDFIIVGGGSAGSVLANRLSKNFKVLVLERGGEANPLTNVPGMWSTLLRTPEIDYEYKTVPQNSSCLACNNNQMIYYAGIGLGGSSIINALMYIRPSPYDFNRFATHTKDDRWNYDNVLPYFLRHEHLCPDCRNPQGITTSVNPKYHGTNGELPVGPAPYAPITSEFIRALEWGQVNKGDMNAPYFNPVGDLNTHIQGNGRRVNAYEAFVKPILDERPSLTIMKYARATQILFNPGTNQATGVKFERFGKYELARASREVIVSAGALESPKLLMLSGIGPRRHLDELNIPVRANIANVGRNLQNHVVVNLGPFLIDRPLSVIPQRDFNEKVADEFLKNGTGALTYVGFSANTLWTSTRALNSGEKEWPDLQIIYSPSGVSKTAAEDQARQYNIKEEVMKEFLEPMKGQDAFLFTVSLGRPKSRGVIKLQSSDYKDDPLIDPRAYEDSDHGDIQTIVEGIQRAVYLAENAPSFKTLGARLSPIPFPTCRDYHFRSDEYWECFAKHFTVHMPHYSGTTSMGSKTSPHAVVDPELNVVGTKSLRVVDAGVMPFVPTVNSYATTLAIAEKAAEIIIKANTKVSKKRPI